MKFLLLLFGLLCGVAAAGQGKLKTEVTAAGDTLLSTGEKKLYTAPGARNAVGEIVKSTVYKSRNGFSLCLYTQTGRTSVFTVGRGDAAEILFKDGSSVRLFPSADSESQRSSLDYGCWIYVFYRLTPEAVNGLRVQGVEKITVSASLGTMTYVIKNKQSDVIREQLAGFD